MVSVRRSLRYNLRPAQAAGSPSAISALRAGPHQPGFDESLKGSRMFENLTDRLSQTLRHVTGKAKLNEDNIKDTLREVRMALLEADVALPVVKDFVNNVKERAVGTEVSRSLTPGQAFVKIVQAELESLMGAANEDLVLNVTPPAVILMAGLQGAGKTTTAGKLARFLKERKKKTVMVVSVDVYRPAAIKQLETLAHDIGVTFFASDISQKPVDIA
ncbi:Signal recognition particle protein, partial [Pseudomonas syringae pv. atrofaciens]